MAVKVSTLKIDVGDMGHITNTYIVYDDDTRNGIVIDPADKHQYIIEKVNELGLNIQKIYLTHCHFDHIGALEKFSKWANAKVHIHKNDKEGIFDTQKNCNYIIQGDNFASLKEEDIIGVKEGEYITVDDINLEVIHTPGHTNGSSILYEKNLKILFTGDTIFSDCYGRTDLKSGSQSDMVYTIEKVFGRFKDIQIYPGHGKSVNIEEAKRKINLLLAMKN